MATRVRGSALDPERRSARRSSSQSTDRSSLPPPAAWENAPFVGRDEELEWLRWLWRAAVDGRGGVVLVAGEPGVGKTRMAQELAKRVASPRSWVLTANCDVIAPAPYRPLSGALRDSTPPIPENLLSPGTDGTGVDLMQLLSGAAPPPEPVTSAAGDPSDTRRLVLDAFSNLFKGLADSAPVLLVLDDLEKADRSTLVMLRHLCGLAPEARLVVFGTYSETSVDRADPLFELLGELRGARGFERRVLAGLDAEAVAAIVGDPEVANALWNVSEGNALCVQQLLRELYDDGYVGDDGRLRRPLPDGWAGPRAGVHAAIDRRLARLDAGTRGVLGAASVVGPEFDLYVVAYALRLAVERVQRAVRRAQDAGVVRLAPPRARNYRFTHALFRERLYEDLAPNQRVRLHGLVAEAVERRPSSDPDDLALLAFHLERSSPVGRSEKLLRHSIRVGDHAMAVGGYEDAAEHYGRALGATGTARHAPERADVLVALAEAHWRSGDHLRARTATLEAATAARDLKDGERLGRAALTLSRVAPVWGRDDVLARLLGEADAMMDGRGAVAEAVRSRLDELHRPGRTAQR